MMFFRVMAGACLAVGSITFGASIALACSFDLGRFQIGQEANQEPPFAFGEYFMANWIGSHQWITHGHLIPKDLEDFTIDLQQRAQT